MTIDCLQDTTASTGDWMYALAAELFPIARSITGEGVRQTLKILQRELPELTLKSVPSGTACFDWKVPPEWTIRDAYIVAPDGAKLAQFKSHNLHVVGYSEPVDRRISLSQLQAHLHSLPEQPDAIPYVTSYYKRTWGFCLSDRERTALQSGDYQVMIDSVLDEEGQLDYGELVIPATVTDAPEILLSTYVCHPSMANNELSGPVVTTALAKWLAQLPERRFTYRIVFIPETIGAIVYLSRNLDHLKRAVVAGFNVSCVGDERTYSYLPTRHGDTISDQIAQHVLEHKVGDYVRYSFLDRGSDERQYNAPGVDLPIASLMRSKFGAYPEYHTSEDNLDLISSSGLQGGFDVLQLALICLEANRTYRATVLCEPQLSKYGLYPTARKKGDPKPKDLLNVLAYSDGRTSLLEIARRLDQPLWQLAQAANTLTSAGLLEECPPMESLV